MGILGWAALIVVLALAAAGGYFFLKRRRRPTISTAERTEPGGRLEILETTPVDETRKLVLVRCDNVEHLMLIGGPGDVVVENDVRKSRSAGSAAPAIGPSPSLVPAPSLAASAAAPKQQPSRPALEAPGSGAARRFGEAVRAEPIAPAAKPAGGGELQSPIIPPVEPVRPPAQPRPSLAAVPAPAGTASIQNGATPLPAAAPEPPAKNAQAAAAAQAQRRAEAQAQRRAEAKAKAPADPKTASAPPQEGQSPATDTVAPALFADRRKPAGEAAEPARPPALPVAQTPWPEADSIENEIVRALRSDAQPPAPPAAPDQPPATPQNASSPRNGGNASTTLGDLAERLEEALAREIQQANQGRNRLDLGLDAFVAETKPTTVPSPDRTPPAARERSRGMLAAAPEAEARGQGRDGAPAERKEEAPVINLNARRREAADPLEDEMARLLGELTSDTSRR